MSEGTDIERFIKDPSLLVELCRDVIEELDASTDYSDGAEREAQLREVSKTIDRMQQMGIAIPNALRVEKLRLASASEIPDESALALDRLVRGLRDILGRAKTRLHRQQPAENGEYDPVQKRQHTSTDTQDAPLAFVTSPRDARKQMGLNQSEFWSRFGVTQSGGSRYESGREIAGPTQILMILYALGTVSDADLFEAQKTLGASYRQTAE